MFAKSYKLKSNSTLKNSEKKHLAHRLQEEFSGVTEDNVKELVPVKSNCSYMKIILHSGDMVGVYVVDGLPMVVEDDKGLVPTVCALWKVPNIVPMLIIHTPVLPKVVGGAPLYLPGVARAPGGGGWAPFSRGAPVAACTQDNQAAALVGRAALSSAEMVHLVAGICLETIQVFGDQLCRDDKFSKISRPRLPPAAYPGGGGTDLPADLSQLSLQPPKEEWPALGGNKAPPPAAAPAAPPAEAAPNEPRLIPETDEVSPADADKDEPTLDDTSVTDSSQVEDEGIPSEMDGLLRWCLLSFLRLHGKRLELPLKTNLLYKNNLMPLCPADRSLDVKKSTYKKVGKFLEAMQQEGLLEVREIEKGVQAIVAVDIGHPSVARHRVPAELKEQIKAQEEAPAGDYTPPAIREVYCITAAVQPLFPGHRKGTALTSSEVRSAVTEYVRDRNLAGTGKGTVLLDATLAKIVGRQEQECVGWEPLMAGVLPRLTAATEFEAGGEARLVKSKLDPVTMQVATRSGNKKVTLVSNLEQFGFRLPALSHVCQQGVAASCGVTRTPGAKADQLMLQGDQTHFMAKLLIEKYGLPKKYVDGADKALKKKK